MGDRRRTKPSVPPISKARVGPGSARACNVSPAQVGVTADGLARQSQSASSHHGTPEQGQARQSTASCTLRVVATPPPQPPRGRRPHRIGLAHSSGRGRDRWDGAVVTVSNRPARIGHNPWGRPQDQRALEPGKPSNAPGPTPRSTPQARPVSLRCHTGCATTNERHTTARSATALPSTAWGRSPGSTVSAAAKHTATTPLAGGHPERSYGRRQRRGDATGRPSHGGLALTCQRRRGRAARSDSLLRRGRAARSPRAWPPVRARPPARG